MDSEAKRLLEHAGWMRHLAERLVRDPQLADDLVQDTWVAVLRDPGRRLGSPRAFLARTLRNLWHQSARSERHRKAREAAHAAHDPEPSAAELIAEVDSQRVVVEELLQIAEPYRTTILLRYFRGASAAEIARREGLPAATVRSRLKRGLAELRARLDERHQGDRSAWAVGLLGWAQRPAPPQARPWLRPTLTATLEGVAALKAIKILSVLAVALVAAVGLSKLDRQPQEVAPSLAPPLAAGPSEPQVELEAVEAPPSERGAPARAALEPALESAETVATPAATATTRVRARFVDDAGTAIPGVTFRLVRLPYGVTSEPAPAQSAVASNGTGFVEMSLELEQDVFAAFDWTAEGFVADSMRTELRSGEVRELGTIALVPGAAVHGRVVDPAGRPVPGAHVWARDAEIPDDTDDQLERKGPESLHTFSEEDDTPKVVTDETGAFRIPGVAFGEARLWAHALGSKYVHSDAFEVEPARDVFGVELVLHPLDPEDTIEGVVLDAHGEPLPEHVVQYSLHAPTLGMSNQLHTDEQGAFRIVVWRKVPHALSVRSEDGTQTAHAGGVLPGTHDVVLQLSEEARCELVVTDEAGAPIEEYRVEVCVGSESTYTSETAAEGGQPDGRCSFAPPATSFWLRVEATGYALGELGPYEDGLVPAQLELALEPAPGISGRVFAAGEPVAGARVQLYALVEPGRRFFANGFPARLRPLYRGTTTDAEGHYVLTPRAEGDYVVRAELDGWAPSESAGVRYSERSGVDGVDVRMQRAGRLVVDVVAPPGFDAVGSLVAANRGDAHARTTRVGPDGRAVFEGLAPGRWNVVETDEELGSGHSSTSSFQLAHGEEVPELPWVIEVRPGETARYELALSAPDSDASGPSDDPR